MDPLSITATAVAFATAILQALTILRTMQGANREVRRLFDEVSDLRIVLDTTKAAIDLTHGVQAVPLETLESFRTVLSRANNRLQALDTFIKNTLTSTTDNGDIKIISFAWVRFRSSIIEIQEDLVKSRLSLTTLLTGANLLGILRVQLQLQDFEVKYSEYSRGTRMKEDSLATHEICEESLHESRLIQQTMTERNASLVTTKNAIISSHEVTKGEAAISSQISARLLRFPRTDGGTPKPSAIRIQTSYYKKSLCEKWCSCICHQPYSLRSPKMAEGIFGSLATRFTGTPTWVRKCNERQCNRQSTALFKISYFLPLWIWPRLFRLSISFTQASGPQITLSMPRIRSDYDDIFRFVYAADIENITSLFGQGLASPFDVMTNSGTTILQCAIDSGSTEVVQFLLENGADPLLEDKLGESAVSYAWGKILRDATKNSEVSPFSQIFDGEEYLESRVFPPLHKIILGLSSLDLAEHLRLNTSSIEDKDATGLTALAWAAGRGDAKAVKVLLDHNANPNTASRYGATPLHKVSQSFWPETAAVTRLLIEAGANIDEGDCFKVTALMWASGYYTTAKSAYCALEPLIEAGADLSCRDNWGCTALHYAAYTGNSEAVKYLLRKGATAFVLDHDNHTPIHHAVVWSYHDCLRILLRDSRVEERSANIANALYWTANEGDSDTIKILTDEIDAHSIGESNIKGLQSLFDKRLDQDASLVRDAWCKLCEMAKVAPNQQTSSLVEKD